MFPNRYQVPNGAAPRAAAASEPPAYILNAAGLMVRNPEYIKWMQMPTATATTATSNTAPTSRAAAATATAAPSYEEALQTLQAMSAKHWTRHSLDAVLRHEKGHLQNACDRILKHGTKDPQLLLNQLKDEDMARRIAGSAPQSMAPPLRTSAATLGSQQSTRNPSYNPSYTSHSPTTATTTVSTTTSSSTNTSLEARIAQAKLNSVQTLSEEQAALRPPYIAGNQSSHDDSGQASLVSDLFGRISLLEKQVSEKQLNDDKDKMPVAKAEPEPEPPKKYIRDEEFNQLVINPEYKIFMEERKARANSKASVPIATATPSSEAVPIATATPSSGGEEDPKPTTTTNTTIADEILKLKSLLDNGLLSEAEFEAAKTKTLEKFGVAWICMFELSNDPKHQRLPDTRF